MRFRPAALIVPVGVMTLLAGFIACVEPRKDYDDFLGNTSNSRTSPEAGGGLADVEVDSKPPTQAVEGLYVATCITVLSSSADNVLRFYTKTKFTPDAATGGGKLTMNMTPLKGYADGKAIQPKCACTSETLGSTLNVTDAPVDKSGKFNANLGKIDLPPEANGISGRTITLDPIILDGRFSESGFCSILSGKVTAPIQIALDASDPRNICLFVPIKDGDTVPTYKDADFVCK